MKNKAELHLLGSYENSYDPFPNLDACFAGFHTPQFYELSPRRKFKKVNKTLLSCIQEVQEPCFLLPAVLDFIHRVNREKLLAEPYRMLLFEFWLNHFSHLTEEENLRVRAKIVGKFIPRHEYQLFFPIGMSERFSGTHFVAAHMAPDIDTTIASFWGWVDAFGARVGTGVHQWSLPGAFPDSHVTLLFQELFSQAVFELLTRPSPTLTLTALDLVTKKDVIKLQANTKSSFIDHANNAGKPILLINEHGHLQGDWRASDAEVVRQILSLFSSVIRWFENAAHARIISVLARESVTLLDIQEAMDSLFEMVLKSCDPLKEATEKQKKQQNDFLKKVFLLQNGIQATFLELVSTLDMTIGSAFSGFHTAVQAMNDSSHFTKEGKLIEDRPKIFSLVEKIFKALDDAILAVRNHVDRLDVLLLIKEKVLGIPTHFVTLKSDVEEIRTKMDNFEYLTVVIPEEKEWFPVGVIYANDIKRQALGTVSLRDFSNKQEVKMASYLEIISVVDHHKSDLHTSSASTVVVADAQSSNTLTAELAMAINDRYSLMGIAKKTIDQGLKEFGGEQNEKELRLLQRLVQLKLNSTSEKPYYVHPKREFAEYLCFLCAILDDTDLLTKVSGRDVECVAALLNRMKSIATQSNEEIIALHDIPHDSQYAAQAASRILQNRDMYSIYKKIYEFKEQEVEKNLAACVAGSLSSIFSDTKEQNGCCRVGQTKLFYTNFPLFERYVHELRQIWWKEAKRVYETRPQIDLHLHMVSTIAGADEVYSGQVGNWGHQDEIWFWVPSVQQALERLVNFLNGFHSSYLVQQNPMSVEFFGPNWWELEQVFTQNFPKAVRTVAKDHDKGLPLAVLRFKAGLINSRKAAITPYLPRFIT